VGDTYFSERPGHLRELARHAAAGGTELLVAVGGDGTVNEMVNGLIAEKASAELAVIPRGTGVDFVRTFDIPATLDDAVRVALAGRSRPSTSAVRGIARGAAGRKPRTSRTSRAPA
jgi:diacylglycerol kinase (ATP)